MSDPVLTEKTFGADAHERSWSSSGRAALADQPLAPPAPPAQPGHVGGGPDLVDEDEPGRVKRSPRLPPTLPRGDDVGPVLLAGVQRF
jgi:hypothetical protein